MYVASTRDVDHPDGADHPVSGVGDLAGLRAYVEAYLDGYEATVASLRAAVDEGTGLSEATLKELISQSSAAGIDVDDFFDGGEYDIAAGIAAARSFDPLASPPVASVRQQLFAALRMHETEGKWLFLDPEVSPVSRPDFAEIVEDRREAEGLPSDVAYIGWGWGWDYILPDGTFKKGEDRQEIWWGGDEATVRELLGTARPFGFVVEGGTDGARFRLVAEHDQSSPEPFTMPDRDDLLTDMATTRAGCRYATSWVEKAHAPKSDDDLLTDDEARALFDADSRVDMFVFPAVGEGEITPWMIKVRPRKSAVVTHYHRPSGSVARVIDLEFSRIFTNSDPRGSFVRRSVTDYVWPPEHAKFAPRTRAPHKVTLQGRGDTYVIEHSGPAVEAPTSTKHRDVAARSLWSTYPRFGEWESIIDPRYGETR